MVSVLLPVRDAESTISACVRSMQRQRLESFECVLVDDGSTDRSVAVYRAAAGDDPRFRIVGGTGEGIVPALNLGLEHCRGTFVARMDGDDVMHRDRLAAQHVAAERSDRPLLLGCHTRLFPRDDNLGSGIRQYEKWLNSLLDGTDVQRDRFVECPLPHPTWFVRRSRMMEIGYQDVDWPEDYDFLLRHLAAGGEIG
ncbi:MAG: glycosyltransferase family 2 protein, partial [Acidobacteriota bacterium]|nr:glycosyltransferase family 2 protein [Acidobacteriota bacterium]